MKRLPLILATTIGCLMIILNLIPLIILWSLGAYNPIDMFFYMLNKIIFNKYQP